MGSVSWQSTRLTIQFSRTEEFHLYAHMCACMHEHVNVGVWLWLWYICVDEHCIWLHPVLCDNLHTFIVFVVFSYYFLLKREQQLILCL